MEILKLGVRMTSIERILRGISCVHKRMRYASCGYCPKSCRVECPDCGLVWLFDEQY